MREDGGPGTGFLHIFARIFVFPLAMSLKGDSSLTHQQFGRHSIHEVRFRHSFSHIFSQLKGYLMKILSDKNRGRNDP